jgi:hypothetical protein
MTTSGFWIEGAVPTPSMGQLEIDNFVYEYFPNIRFRARPTCDPLMSLDDYGWSKWRIEQGKKVPYNLVGPRSFMGGRVEVLDTIIHEEIHLRYPKLTEDEVRALARLYLEMRGLL